MLRAWQLESARPESESLSSNKLGIPFEPHKDNSDTNAKDVTYEGLSPGQDTYTFSMC